MGASTELSFGTVSLYAFLLVTQIVATSLLPRTAGFTNLYWTITCLSVYAVSFWSMSYILYKGMPISTLIPILSAVVPLATVLIGVMVFKEAASVLRMLLLCAACGLIGVANIVR